MVDGEQVPLTAAEIAELEARDAEWAASQPTRDAVASNQTTIRQAILNEIEALRNFRLANTSFVGLSNANKDAVILRLVRDVERLGRIIMQLYNHADD